jgi:hypothetical protein
VQAIAINFVRPQGHASPLGLILFVVGVLVVGAVAVDYRDALDELERVQAQQLRQLRPTSSARLTQGQPAGARGESYAMERAIGQLQLPWDAVLREIEKSANSSVALLSVEAQGRSRTLRLTGEAKTMAEVVAYTRRLRESPLIAAANVTHHENKDGGPVSLIRFAIEASWNSRP